MPHNHIPRTITLSLREMRNLIHIRPIRSSGQREEPMDILLPFSLTPAPEIHPVGSLHEQPCPDLRSEQPPTPPARTHALHTPLYGRY